MEVRKWIDTVRSEEVFDITKKRIRHSDETWTLSESRCETKFVKRIIGPTCKTAILRHRKLCTAYEELNNTSFGITFSRFYTFYTSFV